MKLRCLVLLLWVGLVAARAQKNDKSLLWEVSGNGLSAPSYVYGTIHLVCPADFVLSDSLKAKFATAQQIVMELDMDDPAMMGKMMQTMYMKDGKKLKSLLNEADYALLSAYVKDSLGMGIGFIETMKPFAAMSLFYSKLLKCAPQSYELVMTQMAKNDKKEVLGLETIESQMAIFDKIPYEKQAKMLVELVQKRSEAAAEFKDLVALYKKQDVDELEKITEKSSFDFDGYEDDILYNRNATWIAEMDKLARQKSTLFAVGAAHLGGQKGVLALLRKSGFKVRAVK
ncbi:MAG: TraB/GumN family protein [Runella slithyformis]|jgi:uncharacterized protein|nr:MAG: TraB/GumN family protein [Runella slithyformis]TAG23324.1 MAG: TraB/GumN family protein [Cytophagales bacterium]TAG39653.1 MAG: TraB/GumN family protein [Cytophagia bacterium]TAF00989.1 MAG: TraB/GumN family protein [Runella slithyformis]TAF27138.1 MAG: TraB/GumN family protein [Runella slithyformis]